MNPLLPRTRKPVLSQAERYQELAVLTLCILTCLIFFVQVVLL